MIAYKGFTKEMSAILGNGTYYFELGKKAVTEKSKTVSCGFHCCENPFECLSYYRFDGNNRFFMVEVEGDIDEDGDERIAGTEITPLKELSDKEFALAGMKYIIEHPARMNWQQNYSEVKVCKDKADYKEARIVIVRGEDPEVITYIGQIVGMIKEKSGIITAAKLFEVKEKPGRYHLTDDRKIEEVRSYEEKSN